MLVVLAVASSLLFAPPPVYDPSCRAPTQWRRGTPHLRCAATQQPDWPAREQVLRRTRIANWTLVSGAIVATIGAALLAAGLAMPAQRKDFGPGIGLVFAGAPLVGIGGTMVIAGGVWRIVLGRRHRDVLRSQRSGGSP